MEAGLTALSTGTGLQRGTTFVEIKSKRLLWYRQDAFRELGWEAPSAPHGFEFAVDYHIARLFEDLAGIYAHILEPVPEDIARLIDSAEAQRQWRTSVREWEGDHEAPLLWEEARCLDVGYLSFCPHICFWRVGDTVFVRCDATGQRVDGVQLWEEELVEAKMPVSDFEARVSDFGAQLLAAMEERVQAVEAGWQMPGVSLNVQKLRKEQSERTDNWQRALARRAPRTHWHVVRQALVTR